MSSHRPAPLAAAEVAKAILDVAESDLKYVGEARESLGDADDSWGPRSRTSSFSASSAGEMPRTGSTDYSPLGAADLTRTKRTLNIPPTPPGSGEHIGTPTTFGKRRGSTATGQTKSVALVGLIGFHHQHGHRVEWTFPEKTRDWRHLAMLCLPEGAHNVIDGFGHVYFSIELALEEDQQKEIYFGVSVYGQIKTSELIVREEAETRSYVQKAAVLLAREPCYGWMHSQLRPATMDLFRQRDFSSRLLLEQLLRGLWEREAPEAELVEAGLWHAGLSPSELVRRFGRNTLLIYKLMLLEPRMVLYAENSDTASTLLLSLVSLVPGLLASFSPFHQLECLDQAYAPATHPHSHSQSGGSASGTSETSLSLDTSLKRPSFSWSEEGSAAYSPGDAPPPPSHPTPSESRTAVPMSLLQGPNFLSPATNPSAPPPPPAATYSREPSLTREASGVGSLGGREVSGFSCMRGSALSHTLDPSAPPLPPSATPEPSPASTQAGMGLEERAQAWRRLHGLPLHVFHRKCKLEPYLPMELLMMGPAAKQSAVLAGSSNKYLLQATMLPQLSLGALANAETGQVQILSEGLAGTGKMSAKERKFAEDIASKVNAAHATANSNSNSFSSPEGRGLGEEEIDAWVRGRFEEYTVRLLQAAARQQHAWTVPPDDPDTLAAYQSELPRVHGAGWAEAWAGTHNHGRWLAEHSPTIVSCSKPSGGGSMAELKTSLKDIRQTLRDTVGASRGIRAAMKSRVFSLFTANPAAADDDAGSGLASPVPGMASPLAADPRSQRGSQSRPSRDSSPGAAGGWQGGEWSWGQGRGLSPAGRSSQSPEPRVFPTQPPSIAARRKAESALEPAEAAAGPYRRCHSDLAWSVLPSDTQPPPAAAGRRHGQGLRAGLELTLAAESPKMVRAQTGEHAVMQAALRTSERRRSSLAEPGTPGGRLRRSSSLSSAPQPSKRRSVGMLPEHVSAIFKGMGLGSQG